MRYLVSVLTHGENSDVLSKTIASFDEMVTPAPKARLMVRDGPCPNPTLTPNTEWSILPIPIQTGFCFACSEMWVTASALAIEHKIDYVFWLEHDFSFLRRVDLNVMAEILDANTDLAQITLMRDSVNDEERNSGGVVGKHRQRGDAFEQMKTYHEDGSHSGWIKHSAFFTTNPMLMTAQFMLENPWPSHERECEGKFGIELRERGFCFGAMGNGEPWVEHHGIRNGWGY